MKLSFSLCFLLLSVLSLSTSQTVGKKGFVNPDSSSYGQQIASLNVDWAYDWGWQRPTTLSNSTPYVPQIWGVGVDTPQILQYLSDIYLPGYEPILLGFNEPDNAQQSNMTVAQAISLWPGLVNTGRKLCAPATAGNPTQSGSWLSQFMAHAKIANLRVDYLCVHWYAPPTAGSGLIQIVDSLWQTYGLPVWITEFSPADWNAGPNNPNPYTPQDAINFMNEVIPQLESRSYLMRYSWKTRATNDPVMGFAAIFNDDGSLTEVGQHYASMTSGL